MQTDPLPMELSVLTSGNGYYLQVYEATAKYNL